MGTHGLGVDHGVGHGIGHAVNFNHHSVQMSSQVPNANMAVSLDKPARLIIRFLDLTNSTNI